MNYFLDLIGTSVALATCATLAGCATVKEAEPSYVPPAPQSRFASAPNAYRIFFDGNSITRHGVNDYTRSVLKWDHVAGMAASSEAKDFAHLLGSMIQKTMPERKVELYFQSEGAVKQPHLVIIQTGEHYLSDAGVKVVREEYEKLIATYVKMSPRPLILCTGVWSPSNKVPYAGWSRTIDDTFATVCRKYDVPFVSVESVAMNPACHGWGGNPGVQWHPNDKGQENYAKLLFAAFERATQPKGGVR